MLCTHFARTQASDCDSVCVQASDQNEAVILIMALIWLGIVGGWLSKELYENMKCYKV